MIFRKIIVDFIGHNFEKVDFSRIFFFWSANPEVRKYFVFEALSEQWVYSFENHEFDIDFQRIYCGFVNKLQS